MNDARDLLALAHRLLDVVERETALLRSSDPGTVAPLQREKDRLAAAWRQGIERFNAGEIALDDGMRLALRRAGDRLGAALAGNERVLRAVMSATDRVVATIAGAVREQRGCGVGYSAQRIGPAQRSAASGITLDGKF